MREKQILSGVLQERDEWLLRTARSQGVPEPKIRRLEGVLREDRAQRAPSSDNELVYLLFTPELLATVRVMRANRLAEIQGELSGLLKEHARVRERIAESQRQLAAMPAPGALVDLLAWRDRVRADLQRALAKLEHLKAEHGVAVRAAELKRHALASVLDKEVHEDLRRSDAQRLIEHAERVSATLRQFRARVLSLHIERIELLILDSFQQLARKRALVVGIAIDPTTFHVRLMGRDGRTISPDRLSAGERQLLAVSMLWGLARASGRPIPTVVDTPLGRLDSRHRRRLIKRYFPAASHQVLLLSTDEEIDQQSLGLLEDAVGRKYRLDFDDSTQATQVVEGYFWNGGNHAD